MDVIFDLDGTLADLTHRRHFVASKPKNWKAFFAAAEHDTVIEPIAMVARSFSLGNRVVVCSGRPDDIRELTERWLVNHVWGTEAVWGTYAALYMRKAGDYRADDIVKEELYEQILLDGFKPELVFDDRDRCVALWRRRGLLCAQVAEGDF
jgi:hypothetical protein